MSRVKTFVAGGLTGAGLAYFLDPDRGRSRRTRFRDQFLATVRRTGTKAERAGRSVEARAYGMRQRLLHRQEATPAGEYDDVTLARKVESEVFGDPTVPKGSVNVNVVDGVVELRGEVRTPEDMTSLEKKVRAVHGVADVRNLLHLPKTPAPNKREAAEAS